MIWIMMIIIMMMIMTMTIMINDHILDITNYRIPNYPDSPARLSLLIHQNFSHNFSQYSEWDF